MEDPKPSDDVIVNDPNVKQEPVPSEQEQQEVQPEGQEVEAVESDTEVQTEEPEDRPIKNVESEWKRKYENLVTQFPQMVGQELEKRLPKQQEEKPKYTIGELEEFAVNNPQHARWAREQIAEIQREETRRILREEFENQQKATQATQTRQQAENSILANPRYQEAFVTLPNGQKTWNQDSRLAQTIGQYMNDPDLQKRPDGIAIAAKLAYADLLDSGHITTQKKLASVKRQNSVLKQKVMPEGGGVPVIPKPKNAYTENLNRLRQTGRVEDAKNAIGAYLENLIEK
jgi:hypothetical protein